MNIQPNLLQSHNGDANLNHTNHNINSLANINVVTFNCNGLGNSSRRRALMSHFNKGLYDFVCLQETHILKEKIMGEIISQWEGSLHYSRGTGWGKGLITLFHPKYSSSNIKEIYKTDRVLASSISIEGETVNLINIYAPSENCEKASFFNELIIDLEHNIPELLVDHLILMGDLNIAMHSLDIISGMQHSVAIRQSLSNFVNKAALTDTYRVLHPETKAFTWSHGSKSSCNNAARRLDYIFVGESLAPYIKSCCIKNFGFSDHKAVILTLEFANFKTGKGLYKLNSSLLQDENYIKIIIDEIKSTQAEYSSLNPHLLWDMIKTNVKEISQQYSNNISRDNKLLESRLEHKLSDLESQYSSSPHDDNLLQDIHKTKSLLEIHELNKARGAQIRARAKDIEEGETNTAFFKGLEKTKSNSNIIKRLTLSSGKSSTNETEILDEICDKFSQRYNDSDKVYANISQDMDNYVENLNLPRISEESKAFCDSSLSDEEVAAAAMSLNNDSAPGADGLPAGFYEVFWDHLKAPLTNCFVYSLATHSLSPSQKLGVISLLHKGKELRRDDLNNWRPLTLLNVDGKILAKVLSNRMNKVIDELVGTQQKGFLKGRDISHVHRRIDDILETHKNTDKEGLLVALDFKQAFDKINMSCIYKSLEIFGFGNTFIQWIYTLNNGRQASIKNGGHISQSFPMANGVRQGCVISPQLFLLAVEILAQKIIQDKNIKGLNPHQADTPTKVEQLADDTSLFMSNTRDLELSLGHLRAFSKFSDLDLNLNKCFALSVNGADIDLSKFDIKIKDAVKILGIIYSSSISASKNVLNWESRINHIKHFLQRQYKRKQTIIGRIHSIKTYCLSQLTYIMRCISLPEDLLVSINKLFFDFIWKGKPDAKKSVDKIKRNVLCSDYLQGGLKMINVISFQESILLEWAVSLLNPESGDWKKLASVFFKGVGGLAVFRSRVDNEKQIKGFDRIRSPFWSAVLKTWIRHSDYDSSPLSIDDPIFNNSRICYKGKPLYFPVCQHKGINSVRDVFNGVNMLSFQDLSCKLNRHPNCLIIYYAIFSALKKSPYLGIEQRSTDIEFRGISLDQITRKNIYNLIKPTDSPFCISYWKRKHNIDIGVRNWEVIRNLKENRLRVLAWKILHTIYPTGISLQKMNLRNTDKCPHCAEQSTDSLEHFFVECTSVKSVWVEIRSEILKNLDVLVPLNTETILTGVCSLPRVKSSDILLINKIIGIGRLVISKYKYYGKVNLTDLLHKEINIREVWKHI